jgi:hypothetical protein
MSATTRARSLLRLGLTVVAAGAGWLVVSWLLEPRPICAVPGEAGPSFTCPNRFGVSLPSWAMLALGVLGAVAVATVAWNATAGWAQPESEGPPTA